MESAKDQYSNSTIIRPSQKPSDHVGLPEANATATEDSITMIQEPQNASFAPSSNATASPKATIASVHDDDEVFDPSLTIEDYEALAEHSPPTEAWLTSCARTLSNDTNIQQPWQLPYKSYRLGDCIRICKECVYRKAVHNYTHNMAHAYYFWACEAQQSSNRTENFDVLDRIFAEWETRPGFEKPDPKALVVHLRLGDVIENTHLSAEELLMEGGIGFHPMSRHKKIQSIFSLYSYLDLMEKISEDDGAVSKIHLVGGSHKAFHYKVSKVYAHCLQRGLAKAGKKVEMWIEGRDPDQDFYFMSHAKRMVLSTGGFSRMIGRMVQRKGGTVLGPGMELVPDMSKPKGNVSKG